MKYQISFCFPSFNFGAFIGETLDSIIMQADDRIQIVIIDGGSTDNTAQIVAEKALTFPHIKFIQRPERSGFDRDVLESVVQADGEFCWLFSCDDVLAPGAIEFMRKQITDDWDVMVTNFALCDLHMKRIERHRVLEIESLSTFDWAKPEERRRYFDLAFTTTAFFSFVSSVIVRRSSWVGVPQQTQFVGSCWIIAAQVFGIATIAKNGLKVRYYPGELLLRRGDNDSFMSMGLVKRIGVSIDGFRNVAEHFFGKNSQEALQISRVIKNEYFLPDMVRYRLKIDAQKDDLLRAEFIRLVKRNYSDGLFKDFVRRNIVLLPPPLLRLFLIVDGACMQKKPS